MTSRRPTQKRCLGCNKMLPATTVHFYRCGNWLQGRCKPCDNRHRGMARGRGVYDRIARELGVTPARVKQIEAAALRKLAKNRVMRQFAADRAAR
jgi:hypothetical protein